MGVRACLCGCACVRASGTWFGILGPPERSGESLTKQHKPHPHQLHARTHAHIFTSIQAHQIHIPTHVDTSVPSPTTHTHSRTQQPHRTHSHAHLPRTQVIHPPPHSSGNQKGRVAVVWCAANCVVLQSGHVWRMAGGNWRGRIPSISSN